MYTAYEGAEDAGKERMPEMQELKYSQTKANG